MSRLWPRGLLELELVFFYSSFFLFFFIWPWASSGCFGGHIRFGVPLRIAGCPLGGVRFSEPDLIYERTWREEEMERRIV